ncbi:hypothetical protein O6H91_18G076400 [Diphasiastrum complanatum]|uniref:Uncharacterized protein n=1 Tax=Diphasiastrum complanatum TaxID=34168 RepID=A0ACC2B2T5_DIPCM|nr:hypothetical protein O6H91_18G076400 [Diphasiastrum complanatum]
MAGRVLVLKHLSMPKVIYFLSCWMPSECALRRFEAVCRSFLWGAKFDGGGYVGVAWSTCILPKHFGGLGLPNLKQLATRSIAKWLVRAAVRREETWACLLQEAANCWAPMRAPGWRNWELRDLLLTNWNFKGKGSELFRCLWLGWKKGSYALKVVQKELWDKGGILEMSCWA